MFEKSLFGAKLRELRQSNKLTSQQLADVFEIHKGTISNLERGIKSPSIEMAVSLADYFDVSLDYLVGRSDVPERR